MIDKLLYLGPSGSYTEVAVDKFSSVINENSVKIKLDSINKIVRQLKVLKTENIGAIIPLENSIEGIVRESQDSLLDLVKSGFKIQAETYLDIEHSLISFGDKSQIKTIISHPQALAQCREYILKNWGDEINLSPMLSTSGAVSMLNEDDKAVAAIASKFCADLYNVPIIDSKINDEDNNKTRFILLSKVFPKKTSMNKISISFSTNNTPGALNKVLTVLEKYNLNMSYIDSRPSRKKLGEYVFYIDFNGHIEDVLVKQALTEILEFVNMFEIISDGAELLE